MKPSSSLIAICLLLWGFRALALPIEERVNLREQCRLLVSGAYLKAYDGVRYSSEYLVLVKSKLEELKAAKVTTGLELAKRRKAAKEHVFDITYAKARDEAFARLRSIEAQIGGYEDLLSSAEADLKRFKATEDQLKRQIDPVFEIKRIEDHPDGGYPFVVEYRSPCPKYRFLCALPPKEARHLLELRIGGELPEACRRYSALVTARPSVK